MVKNALIMILMTTMTMTLMTTMTKMPTMTKPTQDRCAASQDGTEGEHQRAVVGSSPARRYHLCRLQLQGLITIGIAVLVHINLVMKIIIFVIYSMALNKIQRNLYIIDGKEGFAALVKT